MQRTGIRLVTAAAAALTLALMTPPSGLAQTDKSGEHGAHHPPGAAPVPAAPKTGMMGDRSGMMSMMHGMMARMGPAAGMPPMMLHHPEGYLAFLKAELEITADQSAPWTAFADAARLAVKKVQHKPQARTDGPPAWPDRLADSESALAAQLEALKAFRPAVAALYAALTPVQKKKADALTAGGMGMRMEER